MPSASRPPAGYSVPDSASSATVWTSGGANVTASPTLRSHLLPQMSRRCKPMPWTSSPRRKTSRVAAEPNRADARMSADGLEALVPRLDPRGVAPPRGLRRRHPPPARPRLRVLPLLLAPQPRARRARHARLHLRTAACLRRRPHRGDRQHDAEVPRRRQALARRRLLLQPRAFDDRLLARGGSGPRGEERELAPAWLPPVRELRRSRRLRDVPVDHRRAEPARPARHPPHLP